MDRWATKKRLISHLPSSFVLWHSRSLFISNWFPSITIRCCDGWNKSSRCLNISGIRPRTRRGSEKKQYLDTKVKMCSRRVVGDVEGKWWCCEGEDRSTHAEATLDNQGRGIDSTRQSCPTCFWQKISTKGLNILSFAQMKKSQITSNGNVSVSFLGLDLRKSWIFVSKLL